MMTNNKDTMHTSYTKTNTTKPNGGDTITRMHPSMKRPRAPIACYRCHHKKVRCDGVHPNCTRCLSTGVLCAYPSSRRSRNTQPTNVDPFIDNLSQLETRIRRIETDLESQRALVRTVCNDTTTTTTTTDTNRNSNTALTSRMLKTEKDLQESRSIVAQLRLRGEQRAARGRRAAAAAAAAAASAAGTGTGGTSGSAAAGSVPSSTPGPDKNILLSGKQSKEAASNTGHGKGGGGGIGQQRANKPRAKKESINASLNEFNHHHNGSGHSISSPSPPFYFSQSDTSSPVDFMNPSPSYYFPYSPHGYTTDMTPICGGGGGSSNHSTNHHASSATTQASSVSTAPFSMMVSDWPLLNDLPHTTTATHNGFVDPMIIAAAEAHQHGIAPPLLSVSSYMTLDEDNSIMAARARSLAQTHPHPQNTMMAMPGLQPSSSSTSTCSNNSNFGNYHVYDTSYTNFMDSSSNNNDTIMMMDPQSNMR